MIVEILLKTMFSVILMVIFSGNGYLDVYGSVLKSALVSNLLNTHLTIGDYRPVFVHNK